MVRYAMGESIPYEEMVGSKRLWIAALRGSDQSAPISPNALCATDEKDNRELLPPNWKLEFRNEIGDFAHPKACDISLGGDPFGTIGFRFVFKIRFHKRRVGKPILFPPKMDRIQILDRELVRRIETRHHLAQDSDSG